MSDPLPTLSDKDLDMLRSYEGGQPRIWDAASLMPHVWSLLSLSLIEPVSPVDPDRVDTEYIADFNNGKACRITDLGRQVLDANPL